MYNCGKFALLVHWAINQWNVKKSPQIWSLIVFGKSEFCDSSKKSPITLILVILINAYLGASGVPFDYGEPVFLDLDFEDGTHGDWIAHYTETMWNGENHFEASALTPTDGGNFSGRFYLGAGGDYWLSPNTGLETARAEIQLKGTAPEGLEIYYTWDFMIPSSYDESDDWQIIGQFHDQPDPALGQNWNNYPKNSPPLSFQYRNGNFIISVITFPDEKPMHLLSIPIEKDQWHTIVSRIYWSNEDDGFMEFWLDGIMLDHEGITRYEAKNCYNNAGNYLNIGLYRDSSITSEGIVYFDNIKSGLSWDSVQ
jgi:hypothetical protein